MRLALFREEELGDRLAVVLKNIHIPDEILDSFVHSGQPATRRCGEEAARGHGATIGVSA